MECEMCGKNYDHLKKVRVDKAIMAVCPSCEHFGTPLENYRNVPVYSTKSKSEPAPKIVVNLPKANLKPLPYKKNSGTRKNVIKNVDEVEIIPEYAEIIRLGREKLGISQEDFASKIKEKRTLIAGIERGSLKPDIKTARKIENFLRIKLIEKY